MTGGPGGGTLLLRTNSSFRLLWTARATSFFGDSLGLVALLLFTKDATGEAFAVALLLLVGDFVPGLFGPVTGVIGDRYNLKRVMISCEAAQGLLTVMVAMLLPPLPVLLALVGLRSLAAQVFQPASRSAVPTLVADRDLPSANAVLGAGTNGLEALGPLAAAALLPTLDVRGVLLLDAATFAVSALLLGFLPALPAPPPRTTPPVAGSATRDFLADARAGLGYIWRAPVVRVIALGFFAVVAFTGVDDVALVFLAEDTLHGSDSAAALLYAGVGIGLAIGYPLLARYGGRMSTLPLMVVGLGVSSAGNLLTGLAWAVGVALALQTVRGIGISALDVAINTYLQRAVPAGMLGRVFGNLYGAVGVAAGLSYVLGGVLLELTSPRVTFVVAGTGGLIATVAVAFALRRRARPPSPPPSPPSPPPPPPPIKE
ncbi:MAG TPA: MFS transporter [Micromonosporaceae bacterium]|nr:MFS transporter [Micromonosporaceae bacterium]